MGMRGKRNGNGISSCIVRILAVIKVSETFSRV